MVRLLASLELSIEKEDELIYYVFSKQIRSLEHRMCLSKVDYRGDPGVEIIADF